MRRCESIFELEKIRSVFDLAPPLWHPQRRYQLKGAGEDAKASSMLARRVSGVRRSEVRRSKGPELEHRQVRGPELEKMLRIFELEKLKEFRRATVHRIRA
jgi:hypothetical protein